MKKGFTLIEFLIYLALTGMVVAMGIQLFSLAQDAIKFSQAQAEFERNLNFIETTLSYWIRQASGILSLTSTSLELSVDNPSFNPTKFRHHEQNLEISQGASGNWQPLNSSNVKVIKVVFEKTSYPSSPPLISFEIEVKGRIKGKEITRIIKSTVGLRK